MGVRLFLIDDDETRLVDLAELKDGGRVDFFCLIPSPGTFDARAVVIRREPGRNSRPQATPSPDRT